MRAKRNDWVFVCGDIWDNVVKTDGLTQILTHSRLFINDCQCPALSAIISAPTTIQPLPRYMTNEDNVVSHLTVIIAIQFISRDEFFFWWLMVAGYEHCWLTFQMVHCWTRVLLDLNIFIEAWTVNMNTSNWVISRLRERLSVLAALTGRDGSLSQIYENSWSQLC